MRRFWACLVTYLEDKHARRTVIANAKAGLDWFPVAPPIPTKNVGFTDFDG